MDEKVYKGWDKGQSVTANHVFPFQAAQLI
jgi:hypothetical protein